MKLLRKKLWSLAAALLLLPATALAQIDCANLDPLADLDGDGLSNQLECQGMLVFARPDTPGAEPCADGRLCVVFPSCQTSDVRDACLDPASADVFVSLVPASQSLLPNDLWRFAEQSVPDGGLGVEVHENIVEDRGEFVRQIGPGSGQFFVRLTERLDRGVQGEFGACQIGPPTGLDNCRIQTQNIQSFIEANCAEGLTCTNALGPETTVQELVETHMRNTAVHETLGHSVGLTTGCTKKCGCSHYCANDTIMQQVNKVSSRRSDILFAIPSAYAASDATNLDLEP